MLITDVRLGGSLTGWELATRIREGNDAFPVIYLTASAAEEWASNGVPHGILIGKPFEATELISAISRLLKTGIEPAPVARR